MKPAREALKGHLPTLLLATISEGPAHGYTIIRRLSVKSGGVFDLPEGTIYPALHRLEKEGLLDSSWDKDSGRTRRVYRLSHRGEKALADGKLFWRRFSSGMEASLEGLA